MDRAALRLKHLSHDLNAADVAVSSINRKGFHFMSMSSFKESGGIESICFVFVLIGLDFKTMLKKLVTELILSMRSRNRHAM